jgi:hypothetical protein
MAKTKQALQKVVNEFNCFCALHGGVGTVSMEYHKDRWKCPIQGVRKYSPLLDGHIGQLCGECEKCTMDAYFGSCTHPEFLPDDPVIVSKYVLKPGKYTSQHRHLVSLSVILFKEYDQVDSMSCIEGCCHFVKRKKKRDLYY